MKIQMAPYRLAANGRLGARAAGRARDGALLRVEFDCGFGYADCHPWPELGDAPLAEQLRALREGRRTPLLARSLWFAAMDAEARAAGRGLFDGLEIPESHWLLTDLHAVEERALRRTLAELAEAGFRSVKIKIGRDPGAEARLLAGLNDAWPEGLRLRFDANASLTVADLTAFAAALPTCLREAIEFVEDPVAGGATEWAQARARTGLRFAKDNARFASRSSFSERESLYQVLVVKPAVQDPEALLSEERSWPIHDQAKRAPARAPATLVVQEGPTRAILEAVVTSYLDHPLGQVAAAWEAARLRRELGGQLLACGLLSHFAYETNDFSAALRTRGPRLLPPEGTGFGFDVLLARQAWQDLE